MFEAVDVGRLIVFEGPDGVGKSTLCQALGDLLRARDLKCEHLSFPGKKVGTIGRLVYHVHHYPAEYGLEEITASSLQALHMAAHLDAIERRILPALGDGRWVVLDRFWWSTWVYGLVAGVERTTLDALVNVERLHWRGSEPDALFLVDRSNDSLDSANRIQLREAYHVLQDSEKGRYPVYEIQNDNSVDECVARLLATLQGLLPGAAD